MSHGTGIARTPLTVPKDSTPLLQRTPYMSPYKRSPWYRKKTFYFNLIRRSMAEFLATALFVFTAISATSNIIPGDSTTSASATLMALAHGMSYAALMAATIHVSGGHLNPAVTLGVFLAGGINVVAVVCYFFAQVLGGVTGAACVLAYDSSLKTNGTTGPWSIIDMGITTLQPGYSASQGILVELLLSLVLVMVFIHTTMEKSEYRPIAPLAVGFALTSGILASFSITGGSLNPVRSFGPAVVGSTRDKWKDHYIYWVGPLLGSLLAGLFYRLFFSSKPLIPLSEPDRVHRTVIHNQ